MFVSREVTGKALARVRDRDGRRARRPRILLLETRPSFPYALGALGGAAALVLLSFVAPAIVRPLADGWAFIGKTMDGSRRRFF